MSQSAYQTQSIKEVLENNRYPGRGIMVGMSRDGKKAYAVYFIMGRSANSQNRVFRQQDNGDLMIFPFDPSKVEDPSLIIYAPVRKYGNDLIVTNGDQTDTIYDFLAQGKCMISALNTRQFEPDAPNYTPRISAVLTFENGSFTYKMNILKSSDPEGKGCNRFTYAYTPIPGLMHFLHTYACDGKPLPSFQGEPERLEVPEICCAKKLANYVWDALDEEYRVSLYAVITDLETQEEDRFIINKNA
ncbi:MAG: IMP cyclohydrolase [Clostridia bacterium]|nr:IMP cyclohydrolase [Clostridia bacterium]